MVDDSVVSGTPAADPTPSATPSAATPAASAAATATPQATSQPPATSGGPDGWVPSYRIRETREAAMREASTAANQRESEIRAELNRTQQQLRALVGAQPPSNPDEQAVRDQFGQLYPGLNKLEAQAARLEELLATAENITAQQDHYWQSYGRQAMDTLFKHAETSLGASLNDEARRQLHSSFVGFVQSSPELTERYQNDPTIVEDFWKAFTSSFIDPARRVASATVAGRAAVSLPQDTPSGAVRSTPAPQPKSLDERADAAWQLFQARKQA